MYFHMILANIECKNMFLEKKKNFILSYVTEPSKWGAQINNSRPSNKRVALRKKGKLMIVWATTIRLVRVAFSPWGITTNLAQKSGVVTYTQTHISFQDWPYAKKNWHKLLEPLYV